MAIEIVDFPIKMAIFHCYVSSPEGITDYGGRDDIFRVRAAKVPKRTIHLCRERSHDRRWTKQWDQSLDQPSQKTPWYPGTIREPQVLAGLKWMFIPLKMYL